MERQPAAELLIGLALQEDQATMTPSPTSSAGSWSTTHGRDTGGAFKLGELRFQQGQYRQAVAISRVFLTPILMAPGVAQQVHAGIVLGSDGQLSEAQQVFATLPAR
jgi:hypothetical protein